MMDADPDNEATFNVRVIPSDPAKTATPKQDILEDLERRGFCGDEVFAVKLALEEALSNAIKHGNRMNRDKKVKIVAHLAEDLIRMEITDEGDGFDPTALPDPTKEPHCHSPCGRGVMLMRNFMTRVRYNAKGNSVVMEKSRSGS